MSQESLNDIVDELADKFGVYGAGPDGDHPKDCKCRICFTSWMEDRIRKAALPEITERIAIGLISAGNLHDVKGSKNRLFSIWLDDFWKVIRA